jgi:hypothetical protein
VHEEDHHAQTAGGWQHVIRVAQPLEPVIQQMIESDQEHGRGAQHIQIASWGASRVYEIVIDNGASMEASFRID